ncbi:NAD(P)/FAD-dependent oxidoreductase [Nocardiopsis sp. RSe5-2]|uniref:NAD(P)/FAD-dependent oxidoreductase n=1 Tax=Nocardiopsis endophytica TaxID=3018445 RepID=A0ABT4U969_9ACTN|nr:NAD(P)/FAD-dependent oxidoreductase [Nocardiopsis endophytica]MDA2813482.1 NAD(P)/FAD-dependent oxidoreductase [Nocardiopsis endophytica]
MTELETAFRPAGERTADPVDTVIVGGGFTGLSAALELAMRGHSVRVLEREDQVGGLAASFDVGDGRRLERFYHHWFSSDTEMIRLCESLGIADRLEAHETRTGMYYANAVYRLSAPLDVLRFAPLPLADRFRLGLLALRARRVRDWRELESRTAEEWLVALGGRRVYEVVWRPLLEGKFGAYADRVGATWMWTKLNLRGGSRTRSGKETLYYIKGGSDAVLTALRRRLENLGADVRTGTAADAVHIREGRVRGVSADGVFHPAGHVLATTAPELAARLLDHPGADHPAVPELLRRWSAVDYLGNICLVLENNRRLSETYWLNVNDPGFPYVGVIEHTNLDRPERYGGRHVVYLSKYLPTDADLYRMDDEQVFEYSLPHIRRMFPAFGRDWVDRFHVWRADHAQPVITPGYSRSAPAVESAVPGLYLCGMAQVFPEDRGTNYAVRDGRRAGLLIADRLATSGSDDD